MNQKSHEQLQLEFQKAMRSDDLAGCFNILRAWPNINAAILDELNELESQFSRIKKQKRTGLVDYNTYSMGLSQVASGLTEIMNSLKSKVESHSPEFNSKSNDDPVNGIVKHTGNDSSSEIKSIKIFLASSSELHQDRDQFDLYFRRFNDNLIEDRNTYLQIIRWEYFLDAMSETRLQDKYNKEIQDCDIFVSLFFTKTGKFTEEEFDVAHRTFVQSKKPLIYTYFKNSAINTGSIDDNIQTLLNFKKKLKNLGHFFTEYDNIDQLKLKFKDQLEIILKKGII